MQASLVVFVCSTYTDLTAEREAVMHAIRRLQLQHDSMEFFGARSDRPIETCLAEVRRSNVVVVIVGHRYGTIAAPYGISFPHAEYEEGYRLGRPCLVYFRDDDMPVSPKHMERDPDKLRMLDQWKATLRERHTIAVFRDAADLAFQVSADLSRTLNVVEDAAAAVAQESLSFAKVFSTATQNLVDDAIARGASHGDVVKAVDEAIDALVERLRRPPTVLLSYAIEEGQFESGSQDRVLAERISEILQRYNIAVLTDLVDRVADPSKSRQVLAGVDAVVFIISQRSVESLPLQNAWGFALYRRIAGGARTAFLPVLLESAEIPPLFRDSHVVDVRFDKPLRAAERIVDVIRNQLPRSDR